MNDDTRKLTSQNFGATYEIDKRDARIEELEAQIASAQQQEPVLYQWKWCSDELKVEWHSWHSCDKFVFEKYSADKNHSLILRKLYAAPVMPQTDLPEVVARPDLSDLPRELHHANTEWLGGEFSCPICGKGHPHQHTGDEIVAHRNLEKKPNFWPKPGLCLNCKMPANRHIGSEGKTYCPIAQRATYTADQMHEYAHSAHDAQQINFSVLPNKKSASDWVMLPIIEAESMAEGWNECRKAILKTQVGVLSSRFNDAIAAQIALPEAPASKQGGA